MNYLLNNPLIILNLIWQHLGLTLGALLIAALIAVPLGWLIFHFKRLAGPILGILGVLYTIPSIALIIFMIPFFGLNARSVIAALVIYCQIILVRNILAGLNGIDPAVVEAARGMGMNFWQISFKVQAPLALPVMLAGARIAAVVSVAIAAIGAKFGAGGLGTLLFDGIAQSGRTDKIFLGAVLLGLLSFTLNGLLLQVERSFSRWRTSS